MLDNHFVDVSQKNIPSAVGMPEMMHLQIHENSLVGCATSANVEYIISRKA
jgi:hypothetical protein